MSYISAIETAVPEYCHTQEAMEAFYSNSTPDIHTKRKINIIAKKSGITKRYSVIPDYSRDFGEFEFFPRNIGLEPTPGLNRRMALFKVHAIALSLKAILKIKDFEALKHTVSHIITVTCTGLFAPGLDVEIARELKLNPSIHRTCINFMGCNAAVIALKHADMICKSTSGARVLVVCVELCTIHFQKEYTDDNILSSALFGDGCAAVMVESSPPAEGHLQGLRIQSFDSTLLHEGKDDMVWQLSEKGFIMNLSSYVSGLINGHIKTLLEASSVDIPAIDFWAVHPGGKRILDDFSRALGLNKQELQASYDVLDNYGNMSSPTILFVLRQIIDAGSPFKKGIKIFAAAFGPGLSIETMQIEHVEGQE
jgi:alpha-pyrone synthase